MDASWIRGAVRVHPSHFTWRGPMPTLGGTSPDALMHPEEESRIGYNLARFLQDYIKDGEEAELAIHPGLRQVVIHVDDALVLTCGFDDLIAGPGISAN